MTHFPKFDCSKSVALEQLARLLTELSDTCDSRQAELETLHIEWRILADFIVDNGLMDQFEQSGVTSKWIDDRKQMIHDYMDSRANPDAWL